MQIQVSQIAEMRDTAKCNKCGIYFVVEDNGPMSGLCDHCKEPKAIAVDAVIQTETANLMVS